MLNKIKYLLNALGKFKLPFFIVMFLAIISSICESLGFATILPLMNVVINGEFETDNFISKLIYPIIKMFPNSNLVILISLIFVFFMLIRSILLIINAKYQATVVHGVRDHWRCIIFNKYMHSKFHYYAKSKQGIFYHNTLIEPEKSAESLKNLIEFSIASIFVLFSYIVLLLISLKITLILSISLSVVLFIIGYFGNLSVKKIGRKRIKIGQDLSSIANESFSGYRQIKLFGQQTNIAKNFKDISNSDAKLLVKYVIFRDVPGAISLFMVALIFFFIVVYFFVFKINVKSMVPILSVFGLIVTKLQFSLSKIIKYRLAFASLIPSIKLVMKLVKGEIEMEDIDEGKTFDTLKNDIEFKDVSFSYDNDNDILKNLNIKIKKGEMTAFIGPSGIGKSTLVDLLVGFYYPKSGKILINNCNFKDYKLSTIRNKIGFVSQDTFIFNMNIIDNIKIGKPDSTIEEVYNATRISHCDEFINKFPDKYETIVGDRGIRLSGGQKQRIAIARAVIRNPEIYIFDEATSSLDNKSEKYIQNSIDDISKNSTVIVIAHRLSTIENANKIYDLNKLFNIQNKPKLG